MHVIYSICACTYIHVTINEKRGYECVKINEGLMGKFGGRKEKEKLCNYIIISKIKQVIL